MTVPGGELPTPSPPTRQTGTFLIVVAGTFGLQALMVVVGVVTARLLGVEGRGTVALVFALGLMASQLTLGGSLAVSVAKNLAERHVTARDGLGRIARRRWWLVLPPAAAAAAAMAFLVRDEPVREVVALALAVLVITVITIVTRLLLAGLQGEAGHLGRMAVVALVPYALYAVVLATALAAGWEWDVAEVLAGFVVVSVVGALVAFRALSTPRREPTDALQERRLWRDARAAYVSSVRPLDSINLDRVLIGAIVGQAALGLYAAAIAVANLCGIIGNAISVIVLPQVARAEGDRSAQAAVARRWLGLTLALAVPIVVVLQLVVEPVIRLAFGEEFADAVAIARWLIVADALFGLRKVMIAVLQGQGRGGIASWVEVVALVPLVGGFALAAGTGELVIVGMTMVVAAATTVVGLALALVLRPRREHR